MLYDANQKVSEKELKETVEYKKWKDRRNYMTEIIVVALINNTSITNSGSSAAAHNYYIVLLTYYISRLV